MGWFGNIGIASPAGPSDLQSNPDAMLNSEHLLFSSVIPMAFNHLSIFSRLFSNCFPTIFQVSSNIFQSLADCTPVDSNCLQCLPMFCPLCCPLPPPPFSAFQCLSIIAECVPTVANCLPMTFNHLLIVLVFPPNCLLFASAALGLQCLPLPFALNSTSSLPFACNSCLLPFAINLRQQLALCLLPLPCNSPLPFAIDPCQQLALCLSPSPCNVCLLPFAVNPHQQLALCLPTLSLCAMLV